MEVIEEPRLEYEYRKRTADEMDTEFVIREQIELRLMPDNSWEQTLGRSVKYYNIDHYSPLKIDKIVIKWMSEDEPVTGYSCGQYMLKQTGIMNGSYYIIRFIGNFQITILASRLFICDSILISRFWINFTIIIRNSLSGRFPISSSLVWFGGHSPVSRWWNRWLKDLEASPHCSFVWSVPTTSVISPLIITLPSVEFPWEGMGQRLHARGLRCMKILTHHNWLFFGKAIPTANSGNRSPGF